MKVIMRSKAPCPECKNPEATQTHKQAVVRRDGMRVVYTKETCDLCGKTISEIKRKWPL